MKSVLITGASTGIGEACALDLDERGFRVFAGVRRDADAERLRGSASERLTPLLLDVTEQPMIERARERLRDAFVDRGLDGLVNNAGISVAGPLELVPLDEIRRQFEVNLFGHIAVTQAFLSLLRLARGRIVNMSSISGRFAAPLLGPYAMSKFALEAFSDSLRRELFPWGIHVACVEPGAVDTPIWEKGMRAADHRSGSLSDESRALYEPIVETMRASAVRISRRAVSTDAVTKAVRHALTATRPKTRYLVGRDAKIAAKLVRFLPDRFLDAVTRKRLR